ncbi:MAG: pilus assembly protein CpaF [Frankiaceae bacterium]|nr:pilus assembly protein CpaF [Frankiaceae bacterium]
MTLRADDARAEPASAALAEVEDELRRLIRSRGIDPSRDTGLARALVEEALSAYGDRTLSGVLPTIADHDAAARQLYDVVAGAGPLQKFLDDPEIEEIWINDPGRVFVARAGRSELTTTMLTDAQVQDIVERLLKTSGRRVDLSQPFVDATLADGSRLHVVIPDITRRHWSVNIRKFVLGASHLDQLVERGSLTAQAAAFLEASIAAGLNVVVAGGTQAGKTTMLNCLAATIPGRERVISCEEVFELRLTAPDWVAMQTRSANLEGSGEISLRRLIKEALRMRPDRLIVGEVRQEEALDLLIALNSGIPGLATIHANSAREAVTKLCTLPLLAGENVAHHFVVPTVASSVDLVVHLIKDGEGRRRVREIVALPGRAENGVVEVAQLFATDPSGRLTRADGYPPHVERYAWAGYDLAALLGGQPGRGER